MHYGICQKKPLVSHKGILSYIPSHSFPSVIFQAQKKSLRLRAFLAVTLKPLHHEGAKWTSCLPWLLLSTMGKGIVLYLVYIFQILWLAFEVHAICCKRSFGMPRLHSYCALGSSHNKSCSLVFGVPALPILSFEKQKFRLLTTYWKFGSLHRWTTQCDCLNLP